MGRNEQLRAMVDVSGRGLEIGPSHAPVFPKREGFRVETVDYAPAAELRRKYSELGVEIEAIEEVDYISDGRPLHEVVPYEHTYDYIFSSHAIEHVTDFVAYIRSCERLLKPGGVIAFAVPDKRYTFDACQPLTTTGRVLEAFARGQSRHSPAAVFDFIANSIDLDGQGVWTKTSTGQIKFRHGPADGKPPFDQAVQPEGAYQDVHAWIFTPNSFRLIISDLRELGLIEVDEAYMAEMGALEFHVALRAGAPGHGMSRLALSQFALYDQVTCGAQMLAASFPMMSDIHGLLLGTKSLAHENEKPDGQRLKRMNSVVARAALDKARRYINKAIKPRVA